MRAVRSPEPSFPSREISVVFWSKAKKRIRLLSSLPFVKKKTLLIIARSLVQHDEKNGTAGVVCATFSTDR
jgi:hypothetical protein